MSTTTPVSSTAASSTLGAAATTTSATTAPGGALGQNQFLQLLMTQMQDQDPLNPSDPTQYMSELAQFTSVEQETTTAQSTQTLLGEQSAATAVSLIGHSVTYVDPTTGKSTSGTVKSVQIGSSGPTLTVDGNKGVSLSSINEVD